MVVFHLVEIGQRHAQLVGKGFLRQGHAAADFAQLCPGIKFLRAHLAPRLCKAVIGFAKPARQAPGSPGQTKRLGTTDVLDRHRDLALR